MLMQIGAKPESDFSEPLGMLGDCHKRIQFFLRDLVHLSESALSGPLDAAQRTALERALRYFQESSPRHTADEEESLFPRLRALKDRWTDELFAKIDALEVDHERADRAHAAVDGLGVRWLANGTIRSEEAARLKALLKDLSRMYDGHLAIEDKEVFPAAAALLSSRDKIELGREMAKRRGLSPAIVQGAPEQVQQPNSVGVEVQP